MTACSSSSGSRKAFCWLLDRVCRDNRNENERKRPVRHLGVFLAMIKDRAVPAVCRRRCWLGRVCFDTASPAQPNLSVCLKTDDTLPLIPQASPHWPAMNQESGQCQCHRLGRPRASASEGQPPLSYLRHPRTVSWSDPIHDVKRCIFLTPSNTHVPLIPTGGRTKGCRPQTVAAAPLAAAFGSKQGAAAEAGPDSQ